MNSRAGTTRLTRTATGGFSLVELLLAVALLLLLLGAVVFNFATIQRGAELEEGARQFEALLRYARAHAANSGHKVRVTFEEDAGDGLLVPLGNLDVTWEADPLGQPGIFLPLPETAGYVNSILDVISIENVRPPAASLPVSVAGVPPSRSSLTFYGDSAFSSDPPAAPTAATPDATGANAGGAFGFAPIVFYPDGASDSAEITIALRHTEEDSRRMKIRLNGLTGMIRREFVADETKAGQADATDATSTTDSSSTSRSPNGEAEPGK